MALSINNNLMALQAANNLTRSYNVLSRSINRLSSGLRINSAADDAAGLAVRELMRSDIAVLNQGIRNANDAISMLQTMDGAAAVIDEKLIRMKELAEQASTGTYSDDQRRIMNDEFAAMRSEIDRIAQATDFNEIKMLNAGPTGLRQVIDVNEDANHFADTAAVSSAFTHFSSGDSITMQWTAKDGARGYASFLVQDSVSISTLVASINALTSFDGVASWVSGAGLTITGDVSGASRLDFAIIHGGNVYDFSTTTAGVDGRIKIHFGTGNDSAEDYYYINNSNMRTNSDGLNLDALSIATHGSAQAALETINAAILQKDQGRAHFGAMINRLENTVSNLTIQAENIQAAESQISDVDVASEMTRFMNTQIKAQAAVAMLAQANMMPQLAMNLLQG